MIKVKIIDGTSNEENQINLFIKENHVTKIHSLTVTYQHDVFDNGEHCSYWYQTILIYE